MVTDGYESERETKEVLEWHPKECKPEKGRLPKRRIGRKRKMYGVRSMSFPKRRRVEAWL